MDVWTHSGGEARPRLFLPVAKWIRLEQWSFLLPANLDLRYYLHKSRDPDLSGICMDARRTI